MKISLSDFDLRQIHDPEIPLFYLKQKGQNLPLQVRRVGKNFLYIDAQESLKTLKKIEGFIVAKDGEGILSLDCKLEEGSFSEGEKYDVSKLLVKPKSLETINRREFRRLALNQVQGSLSLSPKEKTEIQLADISASGVGFETSEDLLTELPYLLSAPISVITGKPLEASIKIISRVPLTNSTPGWRYCCHFIQNENDSPFPVLTEALQEKIIQYVNHVLVEKKKNETM